MVTARPVPARQWKRPSAHREHWLEQMESLALRPNPPGESASLCGPSLNQEGGSRPTSWPLKEEPVPIRIVNGEHKRLANFVTDHPLDRDVAFLDSSEQRT